MSHFATYKVKVSEKDHLLKALTEMGFEYSEGKTTMKNSYDTSKEVDIRLKKYTIGFAFNQKTQEYDLVADWYDIRGMNQSDFTNRLNQFNAKYKVEDFCTKNRLTVGEWQTNEKGELCMVASQWV